LNRDQKAAAIAEIAEQIQESDAIIAVDYRGITVPQAAELRAKLRDADATFRIVKNTLTERAADQVDAAQLKDLLIGPTALTFVRGDAAVAAKALRDYGRQTETLTFKGGILDGESFDAEQIDTIARLPSRDVMYGQLVGLIASPLTGLVRGLGGLIGGLAIALGEVRDKKESGELPAGEAPAGFAPSEAPAVDEPAADEPAAQEPAAEAATETDPQSDQTDQDAEASEPTAATEEPTTGPEDQNDNDDNDAEASTASEADDSAQA
jgi:large subunit ribosomal protein L10